MTIGVKRDDARRSRSKLNQIQCSELVRRKIEDLRRRSSPSNPLCFRYGDSGHVAYCCENRILCYWCGNQGHRAYECQLNFSQKHNTNQLIWKRKIREVEEGDKKEVGNEQVEKQVEEKGDDQIDKQEGDGGADSIARQERKGDADQTEKEEGEKCTNLIGIQGTDPIVKQYTDPIVKQDVDSIVTEWVEVIKHQTLGHLEKKGDICRGGENLEIGACSVHLNMVELCKEGCSRNGATKEIKEESDLTLKCEGQKENKEEQEVLKQKKEGEYNIKGQYNIKLKRGKSKIKKKKEDQMEWLLTINDQGQLVLEKLNSTGERVNV